MDRADKQQPVLIVGGSLVGLSAAMFLAWRGVPTILVEQHPGSSLHPRAIGYTLRTIELFRAVGLDVSAFSDKFISATGGKLRRARVESLAGKWFEETLWTPEDSAKKENDTTEVEYSPCTSHGIAVAQDRLEPLLRDRAVQLGAELRLETELVSFEQDDEGVTASLRDRRRKSGEIYSLRASYMIAADGNRSSIREALGIERSGRGYIRTLGSVLFRASLDEYLASGVRQFDIDHPDGFKGFLTTYGDGRWVLMYSVAKDNTEKPDQATLKAMIEKAVGRSDLPIEIITTGQWEMNALIADRFSSGRVFLAGDAAHTLPPNRGGYGANTGIEDVHNLAWKLQAVLSGVSRPQLLDTYDAERRPIGWLRLRQIFARSDYKAHADSNNVETAVIEDIAMEIGQLYRSDAVLGAGEDLPSAMRPDQWKGQPGTRAPHLWISKKPSSEPISTLDLFQKGWVLLAGDEKWVSAASESSRQLGVDLACECIGTDFIPSSSTEKDLRENYGLTGQGGALLVRPDGYVAWRAVDLPSDPTDTLTAALGRVSHAKIHS